ncbi:MAG: hypothetical protein WC663_01015 [Patescibacteria group bacterium]
MALKFQNEDPVALTQSYVKGEISFPGIMFREKLFAHVRSASTPEELSRVREAMKMVPRMKWDHNHLAILNQKGLL